MLKRWSPRVGRMAFIPLIADLKKIYGRKDKREGSMIDAIAASIVLLRTGMIVAKCHVPFHKWIYALYISMRSCKGALSLQLANSWEPRRKRLGF